MESSTHHAPGGPARQAGAEPVPPVVHLANAEDEATGDAYTVLGFRKPLQGRGTVRVRRERAGNVDEVVSLLRARNADLPPRGPRAAGAVERALQDPPREHWVFAAELGWRGELFVRPDRVLGPQAVPRVRPPLWAQGQRPAAPARAGDPEGWREGVARPCRLSRRLMLGVSAACAAPLLARVGHPSFRLHLSGPAAAGGDLVALAAGSVVGVGADHQLPGWDGTGAGFREAARPFNDSVLPLDEPAPSGVPVLEPPRAAWRGVWVSAGERPLAEPAARAHDVPALEAEGGTVCDRRPSKLSGEAFDTRAMRALLGLRRAIAAHHGHALEPVVLEVARRGDALRAFVAERVAEFRAALAAPPGAGAPWRAAENFGVVYAGGRLAIEAGVLPWPEAELLGAVVACFEATRALQFRGPRG